MYNEHLHLQLHNYRLREHQLRAARLQPTFPRSVRSARRQSRLVAALLSAAAVVAPLHGTFRHVSG